MAVSRLTTSFLTRREFPVSCTSEPFELLDLDSEQLNMVKLFSAMVRSADVAEDRQGGGGGGFSAPAFSIPFQVGVVVDD